MVRYIFANAKTLTTNGMALNLIIEFTLRINMSFNENAQNCQCDQDGFFITKRQTSIICSLLILLFLGTFISGYFWGHGKATHEFTEKLVDDSFTDKINYSFYSNFEKNQQDPEEEEIEEVESSNDPMLKEVEKPQEIANVNTESNNWYYAELIGFGTLNAAQKFVQQALKHGYNINIKQRTSKTANGKEINWFQAVTEKFDNKDQLMDLVAKIQKTEKIKDVKIIEENKLTRE